MEKNYKRSVAFLVGQKKTGAIYNLFGKSKYKAMYVVVNVIKPNFLNETKQYDQKSFTRKRILSSRMYILTYIISSTCLMGANCRKTS